MQNHLNKVLDSGNSKDSQRANLYYDYATSRMLLENLKPEKTDNVLDFGCGIGRLTNRLKNKINSITGFDIDKEYLALAKKANPEPNVSFSFKLSALESATFNKIFSFWVLCLIDDDDLDVLFKEFYRLLSSKGQVYVFEFVSEKGDVLKDASKVKKRLPSFYTELAERHNMIVIQNKSVFRMPSYAMHYWKKHSRLPKFALPFLYNLDKALLFRKPENVLYFTNSYVFRKKQ